MIRTEFSTVNPVDRYSVHLYKTEGHTLGSDGSGVIVDVGDAVSKDHIGRKVAFLGYAWSEYRLSDLSNVILLDDSQDLSKAANAMVNPLTAAGMLDFAKKNHGKVVIISAAASQLGQQFIKLAKLSEISTIGIVRKDEHVKLLNEVGALHALNLTSETYLADLEKLIKETGATILFDFIGGKVAADIITRLPAGGFAHLVGSLSSEPIPVSSGDILFNGKSITGFYLTRWL